MKGTDCTKAQLNAANQFISDHAIHGRLPLDAKVTLPYGQIVRLVAWYGALRYIAARDQTGGTLETPGETVETPETQDAEPAT